MKDVHTTKSESSFGKKLWCVLIVVFLGVIGWQMRELHLYNAAVREAKEAGFEWKCDDALSLIRQDWHNALKKETWGAHPRFLDMREVPDLGRYREMLHHLRPTELIAWGCKDEKLDALKGLVGLQTLDLRYSPALQNVDALKGFTGLQRLYLSSCTALQNLDALKGLTALQTLNLDGCPALQNVDVLKGLTALQTLYLQGCDALQNVDALKGLTTLQTLWLAGCTALQNVDGLKGLTGLQTLVLYECPALQNVDILKGLTALQSIELYSTKIPAAALRELSAALPKTDITFFNGTPNPPQ